MISPLWRKMIPCENMDVHQKMNNIRNGNFIGTYTCFLIIEITLKDYWLMKQNNNNVVWVYNICTSKWGTTIAQILEGENAHILLEGSYTIRKVV